MVNFMLDTASKFLKLRGQGNTKAQAISDTKDAIKLCLSYLEDKRKSSSNLVTVSV